MSTPTRLDKLLIATQRARALVAAELQILTDSHTNPTTGNIDAEAKPEIAKYRRTLKQVDAALAAYGITP